MEEIELEQWPNEKTRELIAVRFWRKVDRRGPNECWPWLGAHRGPGGHGILYLPVHGLMASSSRVSLALVQGPLKRRHPVCHICDNGWCVNPAHLYQGTYSDNNLDAVQRGTAKLKTTDDDVRLIRATPNWAERAKIAKCLGITAQYAYAVYRRLERKYVPD